MKRVIGIWLVMVAGLFGQMYNNAPTAILSTSGPGGVSNIGTQRVGNQGNSTYYYWVIANYPIGQAAQTVYSQIINAPDTLTGGNFVTVIWVKVAGATSYDVLRTSTPSLPATCTCSVATGLTGATINDTGGALGVYNYTPVGSAVATIKLDNQNYFIPRLLIDTPINPTLFAGLPNANVSTGLIFLVKDASTSSTCNLGGGTNTPALCWSNGTTWIAVGGGGGAGTSGVALRHVYAGAGSYAFPHNLNSLAPVVECYVNSGATPNPYVITDANDVTVSVSAPSDLTCNFTATGTIAFSPPRDFSVALNPAGVLLDGGNAGATTVLQTAVNGYTGTVNYTCTDCGAKNATPVFGTNPINNTGTSTLSVTFSPRPGGTTTLNISGNDGTNTHASTLTAYIADPGFLHYKQVTVPSGQVLSNQTNFPVLISIVDPNLATFANGGHVYNNSGFDMVFSSDTAGVSRYNWDVEKYDPVTGTLIVWVQVPSLSTISGATFYLAYSDPAVVTKQYTASAAWAAEYRGVWHLGDGVTATTAAASDVTTNTQVTSSINSSTPATGEIYGGFLMNGTSNFIAINNNAAQGTMAQNTTCGWVFLTGTPGGNASADVIFSKPIDDVLSSPFQVVWLAITSTFNVSYILSTGTGGSRNSVGSTATISQNAWHYVCGSYDGTTMRTFIDGTQDATTAAGPVSVGTSTAVQRIGSFQGAAGWFAGWQGTLDNIWELSSSKDANWMRMTYNQVVSQAAFVQVGIEH